MKEKELYSIIKDMKVLSDHPDPDFDAKLNRKINVECHDIYSVYGYKKQVYCLTDDGYDIAFSELDNDTKEDVIYEVMLWLNKQEHLKMSQYKDIIKKFIKQLNN